MAGLTDGGTATSLPNTAGVAGVEDALFAIAFGSNFPAYGPGVASTPDVAVAGDWGELTAGDKPDFRSISSKILLAPPAAAASRCLRSFSAACFCFQASSLASLSALFSSSVGTAVAAGVDGFDV